jgi:CxxC motif-containing protein (DUF1111 family)
MNARRSINRRGGISVAAILVLIGSAARAEAPYRARITRGKELFVRTWTAGDEKSPKGDGLGPLFNADSCVACHMQGGAGGAGPNIANVQLLTFSGRPKSLVDEASLRAWLAEIHPAFVSPNSISTTIVLHRHSTDPGYDAWRDDLLKMRPRVDAQTDPLVRLFAQHVFSRFIEQDPGQQSGSTRLAIDDLEFEVSERNTPPLFGAALINSVTEKLLDHVARVQAEKFPGISGRVPRSVDGKMGRFGWRGQVATLQDFVQNACSVELGLQLPNRPQAASPMAAQAELSPAGGKKNTTPSHADMDPSQVMELMAFVMDLPRPRQSMANASSPLTLSHVRGANVFNDIGCAACHTRRIGKIDGIYSDLLLHDMGGGLSDPAPAIPSGGASFPSGGYGGGSILPSTPISSSLAELRREWRTPPLWGVRDSAP